MSSMAGARRARHNRSRGCTSLPAACDPGRTAGGETPSQISAFRDLLRASDERRANAPRQEGRGGGGGGLLPHRRSGRGRITAVGGRRDEIVVEHDRYSPPRVQRGQGARGGRERGARGG